MKIMMISDHASPIAPIGGVDGGGQNVYVEQVSRHLADLGHSVDVYTRRDADHLPEVVSLSEQLRVIHVPAGLPSFVRKEELLPFMEDFYEYCLHRADDYDIIHAHFWLSGLVALRLYQAAGIPYVITFHALGKVRQIHQGERDGFPDDRPSIEEEIARYAERVIAECPQDYDDLVSLYDVSPEKISVIPCGVDTSIFSPVNKAVARSYAGIPEDRYTLLQLGRMVPRKGVDNVIRTLGTLKREKLLNPLLLVVGGEERNASQPLSQELSRLCNIAEAEGVADSIVFLGKKQQQELKYFYSAADVFMTTPWYEPFGITPLEAMACGVPVIGSNVGGIKHSVAHGVTGFLVPPNDPVAAAERIAALYSAPHLAETFSRNAIERVQSMFTWRLVAERLSQEYSQISFGSEPLEHPELRASGTSYVSEYAAEQ